MTDTVAPMTPESSPSAVEDKDATDPSGSENKSAQQGEGMDGEPAPESPSEPRHVTELSALRVAEKKAKDAVVEAIQKMRELRVATAVDLTKEYQELLGIIKEFPSSPGPLRSRSSSSSGSSSRSHSPRRAWPVQAHRRLPGGGPPLTSVAEKFRPCLIERLSMDEWRWQRASPGIPAPGHITYNVHSMEPVIQAFYRNVPSDSAVAGKKSLGDDSNAGADTPSNETPQRVKINSSVLFDDLERISGLNLPRLPHIMIPPFKLLIHNWDGIKSTLKRLSAELEQLEKQKTAATAAPLENEVSEAESHGATTPAKVSAEEDSQNDIPPVDKASQDEAHQQNAKNGPKEPEIISSSASGAVADAEVDLEKDKLAVRVSHLQTLHDFITTDLGHLMGLKTKIQEGSLETVAFESIYLLYSPGDLIINRKDDIDQLYQVYAVTGGRMRLRKYVANNAYRPPGEEQEADNSPEAGVGTWTDVVIDCFRMRWNGTRVGPIRMTHRVQHYTGEKKITDLDYYPVRFRDNAGELCEQLKLRGKAVLDCHGHKKYDWLAAKGPSERGRDHRPRPPPPPGMRMVHNDIVTEMGSAERELESDVYVDFKTFSQKFSNANSEFDNLGRVRPSTREVTESSGMGGRDRDYHSGDHDVDEARSDSFLSSNFHLTHSKRPKDLGDMQDYLMLLPRTVPGFEFRQRQWVWLNIEKLEEIDKSDEARRRGWEDLVINEGYSQLLLSLVDNHTSAFDHKRQKNASGNSVPTSQIDLIKGKGRGLIILLHGPPGTGKTSTAETIAAYTGKPLYAITCGDIGVDADEVEDNLKEHTERAEKWGCVLLLDEADVFLARRTWTDMNRNALVSIFLRHLEYYTGILFLTTNIVGIIDEAFKSRIHVALRYDAIDLDSTGKIWNSLLDRILKDNETSKIKIKFDRDVLLEFAQSHYEKHEDGGTTWNARQIRNAFSTAIAMGQFDRLERIRKEGLGPGAAESSGRRGLMTLRLTNRNFAKIAETAADFERYINAVRGSDADNALANQQRDDNFVRQLTPQPPPPPSSRRRNRGGFGEHGPGSRRHEQTTPQSSKLAKGRKPAKKPVDTDGEDDEDDDEDDNENETSQATKPRLRKEEFSDDDESDV